MYMLLATMFSVQIESIVFMWDRHTQRQMILIVLVMR